MPTEALPTTLEDDRRPGVPTAIPRANQATEPPKPLPPLTGEEPCLREGETDLGRPVQISAKVAPLTDEDRQKLREADEAEALRDLAEAEEMLASDPTVKWFGWFAHPLAVAFLLGTSGLLGLFLYSQVMSALGSLANAAPWAQYLGYASMILCVGAVGYSMIRLLILYIRLRRNRQIRLAGLEELQARTRLRWLAYAKASEAKSQLEKYLRDFPMNSVKEQKRLIALGLKPELLLDLAKAREELLNPEKFSSTVEWFEHFRTTFQNRLDQAAESRVSYWAKRTGVVTALAPNALVDSAATIYFGFALLADLCTIYNLRAGRTGTAVLLGRVFFNSYLAGQLTEWEKLTEEQLNHLMAPGGPVYELTAARVLSKLGAKAAGGVLNYFMLSRLGKYACRLLRPVG